MIKEKDIKHENGRFWVLHKSRVFYVMRSKDTHSVSDSAYATLDLAVARCDYLAKNDSTNS